MLLLLVTGPTGPALGQDTTLRVPGTGDSEELLRAVAEAFKATAPGIDVDVPDSVGSTGGIKALLAGKAELARVARPLRGEEKAQGLVEIVFAETPVVFAVNPAVTGVSGLSSAQALAVYAGKITDWSALGGPPGPIARVAREMPETGRAVLNETIPGFEALAAEGQAVAYSTPEAVDMVLRHPGTIGYFSLTAMSGTGLTPLALDGVPPTPEALANAPRAPRIRLSLVYRPPLAPAAERFLAFLQSHRGEALLASHGCRPLPPAPAKP
jgi:phosphate transport system substrate-binding protein